MPFTKERLFTILNTGQFPGHCYSLLSPMLLMTTPKGQGMSQTEGWCVNAFWWGCYRQPRLRTLPRHTAHPPFPASFHPGRSLGLVLTSGKWGEMCHFPDEAVTSNVRSLHAFSSPGHVLQMRLEWPWSQVLNMDAQHERNLGPQKTMWSMLSPTINLNHTVTWMKNETSVISHWILRILVTIALISLPWHRDTHPIYSLALSIKTTGQIAIQILFVEGRVGKQYK